METQRRVAFITLGCKVNTTETEGMRSLFEAAGYRCVPADGMADVYVINTCTVTNMGDKKSRQMIRHSRALNPDAVVAAVGCYAQVSPEEVAAVQGVDLVLGNNRKHLIVPLVEEIARLRAGHRPAGSPCVEVRSRNEMTEFETLPDAAYPGQTRAFLKIQDGCDRFCTYCIIPYARGPVRSRKTDEILDEARMLAARGFTEMVLTGIHLTSFRDGNGEEALPMLIQALDRIPGIARIRLGSLEPVFLSEPVLDALATSGKLCPHFHLSLQSGSASVLKRMNRRYDPTEFAQVVKAVRIRFPDASITTDVMVGFPGETKEEFEESLAFCASMGFTWMHVFPYSPRRGTPAAQWGGQLSKGVKEARAARMTRLAEAMRTAFHASFTGHEAMVLFEHDRPGRQGWQEGYTPNYIHVAVPSAGIRQGELRRVLLEKPAGEWMEGSLCGPV